jgi:beta-glucosidase-like glycosyl hydrolase
MSALNQSLITVDDIDERLSFLWRVRMRLSHFDPLGPLDLLDPTKVVCSDHAKEVAREGSRQGSTLVKNIGKTLPLDAKMLQKVAVIGPNGNLSEAIAHYYGGNTCDNMYYNMVDAVSDHIGVERTMCALGVPDVHSNDTSSVASAAKVRFQLILDDYYFFCMFDTHY